MGKERGFLEHKREQAPLRPVHLRVLDWREVQQDFEEPTARRQGARCMDCGVPFCSSGCPLGNAIPEWNDLVYRGRWKDALRRLELTNPFPEFTGIVCPAPCETACVLGINDDPVTIRQIEWEIIRRAYDEGWMEPRPPVRRTHMRVAIVGSGPAGLAAAHSLNQAGHHVTVFEKARQLGGLLRLGIPDFKLEKWVVQRRIDRMQAEGVSFRTGVHVGVNMSARVLVESFDAVVLAGGSEHPRDLQVPGRELGGVHFAMEFLTQQNHRNSGEALADDESISAQGKHVIVLGGGDTGSDCIGTSIRQGALSVTSLELMEQPPDSRSPATPWPNWPVMLRTSSSHEEGGERQFAVLTKRLTGSQGRVEKLHAVRVRWDQGTKKMVELEGSELELQADLVLLAMGFVHPVREGLLQQLGVSLDSRGNVAAGARDYATSIPGVFAAGDMRRGQSLVVWAIMEGRDAAKSVDQYLRSQMQLSLFSRGEKVEREPDAAAMGG